MPLTYGQNLCGDCLNLWAPYCYDDHERHMRCETVQAKGHPGVAALRLLVPRCTGFWTIIGACAFPCPYCDRGHTCVCMSKNPSNYYRVKDAPSPEDLRADYQLNRRIGDS